MPDKTLKEHLEDMRKKRWEGKTDEEKRQTAIKLNEAKRRKKALKNKRKKISTV